MTNPSPTRPQRAAESIYQIGFIRHFNVDLAQDPRNKNGGPAGIPDNEFAVIDELSRGDSFVLSSQFRNQYSIRRTDYSVGGIGYGIYQNSDLIAWVNTDDENLQRVLGTGNRALNNRALFNFT